MAKNNVLAEREKQEIVITRIFDAPRELVWKAWTAPEHFKRWWGPKDYTCPFCQMDLRVGGKYLNCLRSPEGQDFWSTVVAVHSHVRQKPDDLGAAVVHIFRFENGRIVELWDLGQEAPAQSPNQYGMC